MVAVVGRPNVGKSTLVNRILGRREAVVEDIPGVTRDRVAYDANWSGRALHGRRHRRLGAGRALRGMAARVAAQAEVAVDAADAVLFVVDADGRRHRRRRGRRPRAAPVAASRSCWPPTRSTTPPGEPTRPRSGPSGLGEPYPVSALHGRGTGDLLDAVLAALPEAPRGAFDGRRAARAGSRSSAGPTSASRRCSTSSPARSASSSTRSPAPPATRSTS